MSRSPSANKPRFSLTLLPLLSFLFISVPSFAETIELVTYYPAPGGGGGGTLRGDSLTVGPGYAGENPPDGTAIIEGQLGVGTNNPQNALHVVGGFGIEAPGQPVNQGWNLGVTNAGIFQLNSGGAGPGGPTRFAIDANGNVGFGTNNPVSNIEGDTLVMDLTSAIPTIALHSTNSTLEAALNTNGGVFVIDVAGHANAANNNIVFRTGNINSDYTVFDRMIINSSGNVGIGTVNPNADPSPANGQATGNLDVNDVFIRSTGRWASQTPLPAQTSLGASLTFAATERVLMSRTVTKRGGPLLILGKGVYISGAASRAFLRIRRTNLAGPILDAGWVYANASGIALSPIVMHVDTLPAGTYTYVLTAEADAGTWTANPTTTRLIITEY